mgnify:CR=1 FL=1
MKVDIQITDQDLPVLSVVATEALEMLKDPEVSNSKLETLIRRDPSLTQRVLHTANSPFYAGRAESQTISQAILRLGLRQLRNVIIIAATGELFHQDDPIAQAMWEHSVATAIASANLSEALGQAHSEEAFIAGMLHDVGKMIIYRQHPEIYQPLIRQAEQDQCGILEIEENTFKYFTHVSVGGLVIRKWNLAEPIAEAARFHHLLEHQMPTPNNMVNPPQCCIVSLANVLVTSLGHSLAHRPIESLSELFCVQRLGLNADRLDAITREIAELLENQNGCFA